MFAFLVDALLVMNLLGPHQVIMNPFTYNIDSSTVALLSTTPGTQNSSAGKMTLSNSFRISDILDSNEEKANTSGENGKFPNC